MLNMKVEGDFNIVNTKTDTHNISTKNGQ